MSPFQLLLFYIFVMLLFSVKLGLVFVSLRIADKDWAEKAELERALQVISSLSFALSCFFFLLNAAGLRGSIPLGPAAFIHHLLACLLFICSGVLDVIILLFTANPAHNRRKLEICNYCYIALMVATSLSYGIYSIYNYKTLQKALGEKLRFDTIK